MSTLSKGAPRRAVFLDRDGTINIDPGYLNDPEKLHLFPGVGKALKRLQDAGFFLIVVSNQSGVGRGIILQNSLVQIHARLDELLREFQVEIARYELCFHLPDDGCLCRKPKPELILRAAKALEIDLSRSYMVGDKDSDLEAGMAAGCLGSLLVRTGNGANTEKKLLGGQALFVGDSLVEVADWILKSDKSET